MPVPDWLASARIEKLLAQAKRASGSEIRDILRQAESSHGLTLAQAAVLLQIEDQEHLTALFQAAGKVKEQIYGRRVVIFAPLYLTNACCNNCLYCGFRAANRQIRRRTLTIPQIVREAQTLEAMGHKRLLLVAGEGASPSQVDYVVKAIEAIYREADIRRLNINIAPLPVEDFRRLKSAGIGTYQLFQETYHLATYAKMHPTGPKRDYHWRLTGPERALAAGIDDLGMGVLYGLYDYKYDTLALLAHARYLDETYGIGPHTLSVPRLKPALGSVLTEAPHAVSDRNFMKVIAVLRLAVPYTGLILSTREGPALRDQLLHLGISQISAGSAPSPGGYWADLHQEANGQQFAIEDQRSLDEIIASVCRAGFIPSFCTACYRRGRTGERFMSLAKTGKIQNVCQPNALLSLYEYFLHYGTEESKDAILQVLDQEKNSLKNDQVRRIMENRWQSLKQGAKDLYF